MLHLLAERILSMEVSHPLRVGIDGTTASGKTTLADELASHMEGSGRQVIRACLDDFHNPPEVRYRIGRDSPEGYYRDAIDWRSVRELLLEPLGPDGSRRYSVGAFGQPDGSATEFPEHHADDNAIALIDGVFLFRPELNDCWDYRIFVEVTQVIAMERGIARDVPRLGSEDDLRRRYEARYIPGERLYLDAVKPWLLADAVISNDEPKSPSVRFHSSDSGLKTEN